jgi:hypothetical protein
MQDEKAADPSPEFRHLSLGLPQPIRQPLSRYIEPRAFAHCHAR